MIAVAVYFYMTAQIPQPDQFFKAWRLRLMDPYSDLKSAHSGGAMILGIEHDGRMHHIETPEWSCPPDRYLAVAKWSEVKPLLDECIALAENIRKLAGSP